MARGKKKVIILDQVSGYAQIDIIEALFSKYDECVLIAGEIKERNKPFPKKAKWDRIIRYNRNKPFKRIYTWLVGSLQMFFKVLFKYRKARIIAISNPPFAIFIPWLLGCRYDVVIYDIYPDALVHMDYLKSSNLVIKAWARLNQRVFNAAQRVITLSDGMKSILSRYVVKDKIEVIPNWSFNSDLPIVEKKENLILQRLGVTDKFIISYSGNFGMTHPLEVMVELAAILDPEVFHVIVAGDGARKPIIEEALKKLKPSNLSLLPWQLAEELHHVLSMGDLGVVVLDDTAANISIPSKTYDLLSAGTPILAICSESASLSKILTKHECGITLDRNNVAGIAETITQLSQQSTEMIEMSENALRASKYYTSSNAYQYV